VGAGLIENDVLSGGGVYTVDIVSGPDSGDLTGRFDGEGTFQYVPGIAIQDCFKTRC
jgi:hypothetical protein